MHSFSRQEIDDQVNNICATKVFRRSERMEGFLRFVIDEYQENRGEQLKAWTIAVAVFNRPLDLDIQTDSIVRVYGGKLRRALKEYYENEGKDDQVVIRIPKGRYKPVVLHRDKVINDSGPVANKDIVVNNKALNHGIAVLMFDCLTQKDEFDYLASGLTFECIIALTQFPNTVVIGPLSRNIIKQKNLDFKDIGNHYNARFVLDANLRVHGSMLRLSAHLVDSKTGMSVWAESLDIDKDKESLMEIEKVLIGRIASSIADSYGVIPRVLTKESFSNPTAKPASYDAMLHFYHYLRAFSSEAHLAAVSALENSLESDPDNPNTMSMLADLIATAYQFGYTDDESMLDRAEVLTLKAVSLDPKCQQAVFVMGLMHFLRWRRKEFLTAAEDTLRLNPNNAQIIASTFIHVAMVGEWNRGLELMQRVMHLNPHHPGWYHFVSIMNHYRLGEYDQAWSESRHFNTPNLFWDPLVQAAILGQLDRHNEAEIAVEKLLKLVPDFQDRGVSLMRRLIFSDENIQMLMDGLHKAGLKMDDKMNKVE